MDVQEGGQSLARVEPAQGRVHHHVCAHELARPTVFAVQASEVVEALAEVGLGEIDDGIGHGPSGGEALLGQSLRDKGVGRVERIAELDRAVLARQERRQDGRHGGLGPRGVGHGLVEHHGVLREALQLRCRIA